MSDNLQNRGPQDRDRVNISQDHERRYWSGEFGVTEYQLREAVLRVGSSAERLREYFANPSNPR